MIIGLEDFIAESSIAGSVDDLKRLYLGAIEAEGYQNAVHARVRNQRLVEIPWIELPPGYSENYIANGWDKIDPVVRHIHSARRPFTWKSVCEKADLTSRQLAFIEECRELGVHSGITIPLHGPGPDADLISISLRDGSRTVATRLPHVYGLTVQYRFRLSELEQEAVALPQPLTAKEIECLKWCREGKTNWEIGEIMNISEKTVEFHLSNTIRKLGVSNRITAVVKGLQCGIISL